MKSPFQQMLSKMLAEQDGMDILRGIDIDAEQPSRIVPRADDVVNTANDIPQQNDGFNFQTPDGAVHQDTNGNGQWDPGEVFQLNPPTGPIFNVEVIACPLPDGSVGQRYCLTYNINGQDVAWVNGAWQCVGTTPDGDPFLATNVWYFTGGWYVTSMPTGNPDMPFMYFMTQDSPWGADCTWWNPLVGYIPGTHPSWGGNVGWQVGDFQGNIPLVPGGEIGLQDLLPGWRPGMGDAETWRLMLSFTFTWGDDLYPEQTMGQRLAWGAFWMWYFQTFGEYPPEWSWPDDAPWWKTWWKFEQGSYEAWLETQ